MSNTVNERRRVNKSVVDDFARVLVINVKWKGGDQVSPKMMYPLEI